MNSELNLPLVTLRCLTYNQEKYIADTVHSLLQQDYPNLEIIISDDCSQDATFDIVSNIVSAYNGPHKVILNRNEPNLGVTKHLAKSLELTHGVIIVENGGDDISLPNRVSSAIDIMLKHPDVMSLSSETEFIDSDGAPLPHGYETHIRKNDYALLTLTEYIHFKNFYLYPGCSRVVRRSLYDAFPPLQYSPDEDIYMFVRSLFVGSIAFIHKPLVLYRQVSTSITHKRYQNGGWYIKSKKRLKDKELSLKQFKFDLDYAVQRGYVLKEHQEIIWRKLSSSFDDYIWKAYTVPQYFMIRLMGFFKRMINL